MAYFRRPKTTQERRRYLYDLTEHPELRLRVRRSFHSLPSSWDDVHKSGNVIRSWKRHRKTQYGVIRSDKTKFKGNRCRFDTPFVKMHCSPFWHMQRRWSNYRGEVNSFPFRVRFKYIKNKTS